MIVAGNDVAPPSGEAALDKRWMGIVCWVLLSVLGFVQTYR